MIRPLTLESLEERATPAAFGNPWPDAAHLTISFAPDGTNLGGQSSQMFKVLDTIAPRAVWQRDILRAVQAWTSQAGINVGLVDDGGQAFGTGGRPQSDTRFGDIRIGGGHYGSGSLAFATPFDITAGTSSGDIRLNLDAFLKTSRPDLYTVVLQEFGHALGIGNSANQASCMFEDYCGPRTGLSAGDVANVQALYGPRPGDGYEGASGNSTMATAARLNWLKDSAGLLALSFTGDLKSPGDVDMYRFVPPSLTGSFRFVLQREGYSLLAPKVTLLNASGKVIAQGSSTGPSGDDIEFRVSSLNPLATYYLRIESTDGVFGVGGYNGRVEAIPLLNNLLGAVTSTVVGLGQTLLNNDLHTNDTPLLALNLFGGLLTSPSKFDATYQGSISDNWDKDYYRVTAPSSGSVMQVMAWGTGNSAVLPRLHVLDAQGRLVQTEVIVNDSGTMCIQMRGVKAGATYFVGVDSPTTGNYFLGVDFTDRVVNLNTFVNRTLDGAKPSTSALIDVTRAGLFHFVLGGEVRLTITDSAGNVVRSLTGNTDLPVSTSFLLTPGRYRFRFDTTRTDGRAVDYTLKGTMLSDPIGPQAEDTTYAPSQSSPPPDEGMTQPSEPPPDYSWYYWYMEPQPTESTYGGPRPEDPYGDGYRA